MPSIVGAIKINSVGSSGVVNVGDSFYVSPKSTNKTFAGANSFSTGDFQGGNLTISATNTLDNDLIEADQFAAR